MVVVAAYLCLLTFLMMLSLLCASSFLTRSCTKSLHFMFSPVERHHVATFTPRSYVACVFFSSISVIHRQLMECAEKCGCEFQEQAFSLNVLFILLSKSFYNGCAGILPSSSLLASAKTARPQHSSRTRKPPIWLTRTSPRRTPSGWGSPSTSQCSSTRF